MKNLKNEDQIILLIIQYGKGWHYLAVKKLFLLLSHDFDFYGLNYLLCSQQKTNLGEKVRWKYFCGVAMPSEDYKILLEFNQYWSYDKKPCIIYERLEY